MGAILKGGQARKPGASESNRSKEGRSISACGIRGSRETGGFVGVQDEISLKGASGMLPDPSWDDASG